MASPAPKVTIARPSRSNGVLSIPASATQRKPAQAPENHIPRPTAARMKIVVRRLAPGLTQPEFEEALGEEWKLNGGKVDWAVYKLGKVSKDPAKPSRPSRAYLHLTKQEYIGPLSDKVRNTTFNDASGSSKDSALLGPPSVEFAPYGRVPNSRPRKDARQGTIDQDPDFIDFLEGLTNPVSRAPPVDQDNDTTGKSKDKVTVTPLIQFLRDKKANKGKESAAPSKNSKHSRQDSKDVKSAITPESKASGGTTSSASPKKRSAQAVKVEQVAREAVKVLSKQAAIASKGKDIAGQPAATSTTAVATVAPISTVNAVLADKRRERGNASAAAKILQRDLGIGGGRGGRRGPAAIAARNAASNAPPAAKQGTGATQAAVKTNPEPPTDASPATSADSPTSNVKTPKSPPPSTPPTGPAASRFPPKAPASANTNAAPRPSKFQPPSNATQAFLKHANPSQGITEPLLEEAFAEFGTINKVEIDKKKGFAYVDFTEPESLQKAIKASPIKVAQGQVVVLERKTGPILQARNTRGGPTLGNRGGGLPPAGRGGPMRGRGGFARGGAHMPNANLPKAPTIPVKAASSSASAATPAGAADDSMIAAAGGPESTPAN